MAQLVVLLFLFVGSLQGAFEAELVGLSREFLEANARILKLREEVIQEEFNYTKKALEKRWTVSGQTAYSDDESERGPGETTLFDNRRHEYGVNLRKDFATGGALSLSQAFTGLVPRSPHRQTSYGLSQGLSYNQDLGANFWGRSYRNELERVRLNVDYSSSLRDARIQEELYGFATSYMNLKLQATLLNLQDQAVDRAQRRVSFVRQRVFNGLKERVDLYQSQTDLLLRQEERHLILADIVSGLVGLSREVGREVERREVSPFSLDTRAQGPVSPPSGALEENLALKMREIDRKRREHDLERAKYDLFPRIGLGVTYRTNDYDPRAIKAFSRGHLVSGKRRDVFTVQASLDIPLSFDRERAEIGRIGSEIRVSRAEYSFQKHRIEREEEEARYRLSQMEEKIASAQRRRELAGLSLRDYNNLYGRGLADLDQVIRAEEDLINTQRSLAQYFASRRQLHLLLGLLYGNLVTYLLGD